MSVKFFIYCLITILVIWAMDSVNINGIFKKNKILQARIFYFRHINDLFNNKLYIRYIHNSKNSIRRFIKSV